MLDNHGAKECGGSIAYLQFTHDGDLPASLKSDIESVVALNKRSRIYVIFKKDEKLFGSYLIGHRKGAPWEGFGDRDEIEDTNVAVAAMLTFNQRDFHDVCRQHSVELP